MAWLNANKSGIGALFILALVVYAVFFPHPERGPREIAAEIMPSQTRVNEFRGEPRDINGWQELHKQYVEEIKLKLARKEVRALALASTGGSRVWGCTQSNLHPKLKTYLHANPNLPWCFDYLLEGWVSHIC
jgi:hypothetical protein